MFICTKPTMLQFRKTEGKKREKNNDALFFKDAFFFSFKMRQLYFEGKVT